MECEASRTMPAGSRLVFAIAADVARTHRWLPEEITVRRIADDLAEVEGRVFELDRPDYAGWLQVADRAGGASEVVIHLSFLSDASGRHRDGERTRHLIAESLDRLAAEVGRRIHAPGA